MTKRAGKPFMAELQRIRRRDGSAGPGGGNGAGAAPEAAEGAASVGTTVVVDNSAVLNAIQSINDKIDRFLSLDHSQIEHIQVDISDISGRIKATKAEMAALRHPLSGEDKFTQASEELGAVVAATESATTRIMASAEELEEIVRELKAQLPPGYQSSRVNDMIEAITRIYEACNFQDVTGQRISKVVRALSFIEERVDAMMGLWNRREFETMPIPPPLDKDDAGLSLTGPKPDDSLGTFSQSDIDALFD